MRAGPADLEVFPLEARGYRQQHRMLVVRPGEWVKDIMGLDPHLEVEMKGEAEERRERRLKMSTFEN